MPDKLHIGLITTNGKFENDLKTAVKDMGGGYIHCTQSMLEMYQKLQAQNMDLLIYILDSSEADENAKALVSFFRNKAKHLNLPILILTPQAEVHMKNLITDAKVRGFSMNAGVFIPLMNMTPIIQQIQNAEARLTLDIAWIESEFLLALRENLGQDLSFTSGIANDDETHSQFYCQSLDEARGHLGWFKISARILKNQNVKSAEIFSGMDEDSIETVSEVIMNKVTANFMSLVRGELISRGSIFFPEIDQLKPTDRKQLYSGSKSQALAFRSEQLTVLLEIIQYL